MNFVADTHALLWWFTESPKITKDKVLQNLPKIETIW
jgi:PIN domain nuclease of toxin-antitoxin system